MLSTQLRQTREDAGLSISMLATRSGVAQSTISEIESGVNPNPSFLTVVKLANVLQVSLDLLAERTVRHKAQRTPRPPTGARAEETA